MRPPEPADFDAPLMRCPLCASAAIGPYDVDHRGIRISRCGRCGVRFMNPQYTDAYLDRLYARYNDPALDQPHTIPEGRGALMRAKRESNVALIARYTPIGRFLSIGSGSGEELECARDLGWKVEGYDVDPATTAALGRRLGVPVYSGDLTTTGLPSDAYDCVYMDQVLEHPKDPAQYLRLKHRVLKRGGVLYLGVPNIRSLSSAWKTFLGKWHLKPLRGRHYDTWHHLFYYSPATLRRVLTQHFDFDVLLTQGDPIPKPNEPMTTRVANSLRQRFPMLDSSVRVLARPRK